MSLQSEFLDYLAILASKTTTLDKGEGRLYIRRGRTQQIRDMSEKCECTPQFKRLVEETKSKYAKCPDREGDEMWQFSVRNVLRRAKIYADAFDAEGSRMELLQRFVAAFSRSEDNCVLLAPLEYVQFTSDDPLEFGSFRIQKYSEQELSAITENETRMLFYSVSMLDLGLLSQYWWIVAHYKTESSYPGPSFNFPRPDISVERNFSRFPPTIECILQTLVLYDWDKNGLLNRGDIQHYIVEENTRRWFGFSLPFIIRCGGSLFRPPSQPPDISPLTLEPVFNDDPVVIGERPRCDIFFNQAETTSFSGELERIEKRLKAIRDHGDRWKFIDVGVKYLVKAFFANELDQFLWHMVALDALLGDRKPGLTNALAQRTGSVLGSSKAERKKIGQSFKKLYDLRSAVVHGNTKLGTTHAGYLAAARYIACDVTVWLLQYLCFVAKDVPPNDARHPQRAEILSLLDTNADERMRISHLIARLPKKFPNRECWDET